MTENRLTRKVYIRISEEAQTRKFERIEINGKRWRKWFNHFYRAKAIILSQERSRC